MNLTRLFGRTGPRTPVLAECESTFPLGRRLEGWRGLATSSTPRGIRGGERLKRVRTCWSCNKEDHLAAACPEVPKELQDTLARHSIQFDKAVRWEDRKAKGASPARRDRKTVHNLRVAILQSIRENLYKEIPDDWDSHFEKETTRTGTSGSGNEVGKVRL